MTALRESAAFKTLEGHHKDIAAVHLRDLFADDPSRGTDLTAEACGLFFDYSKNLASR